MSGCKWPPAITLSLTLFLPIAIFNTAYAADYGKSTLIDTIRLGEIGWENGSPSSIVVNPDTNTIYVANRNSDTVVVIDAAANNVTDIVSVGYGPLDIALNPNTNMLYVVNAHPNTISVIDPSTNNVTATIDLTEELASINALRGIAINTETNNVYVLINSENQAFIAIIDGLTNKAEEVFKIADLPPDYDVGRDVRDIAVNSVTDMIYVTMDFDSVLVIDGSDNRVVTTINVEGPTTVAINEKTNTIYSGNFFSQSISIINGSSHTVIDTLKSIEPQRIEVDEQTNTIYVSGYGGLTIIDGESRQVKDWIMTDAFSEGVALNPNTGLLYVASAGANTVSVIQTHSEPEWKTAYVRVTTSSIDTYDATIKYKLSSGEIGFTYTDANGTQQIERNVILTDPYFQQLSVNIINGSSGTLVLELPRSVIDSKMSDNVTDAPLTAFFRQNGVITPADIDELNETAEMRVISIDFPALQSDSAYNIGIQGSYVIPEFDSTAAFVMVPGIIGSLLAVGVLQQRSHKSYS